MISSLVLSVDGIAMCFSRDLEKCLLLSITTGSRLPNPHAWVPEELGGQRSLAAEWELGLWFYHDTSSSTAAQRKARAH